MKNIMNLISLYGKLVSFNQFIIEALKKHANELYLPPPLAGQLQQAKNSGFSPEKQGFEISCRLSPTETNCIKCQILLSWKIRKVHNVVC